MALKMNYSKTIEYISNSSIIGVPDKIEKEHIIENAYVKIGNMQGAKEINFNLEIYEDDTKQNLICVDKKVEFKFSMDFSKLSSHVTQAYEYLKTLPEFKEAVGC